MDLSAYFEKVHDELKSKKQNSVDGIINWCKEVKLIDGAKDAEEKIRSMFDKAQDKANVDLEAFKDVISKFSEEKKGNLEALKEDMKNKIKGVGSAVAQEVEATMSTAAEAFGAGISAFKEVLAKKKK